MKRHKASKGYLEGMIFWLVMYVAALASTGCASTSRTFEGPKEETYTLLIENQSWDAKRVRVFCGGAQVRTIHGLITGQASQREVEACPHAQVRLGVEYIGRDPWVSEPFTVNSGEVVKLTIAAFESHNTFWKGQEGP